VCGADALVRPCVLDIHHACFVDEGNSGDARLMNVRVEMEPIETAMSLKEL
jgi:hypothetical protein